MTDIDWDIVDNLIDSCLHDTKVFIDKQKLSEYLIENGECPTKALGVADKIIKTFYKKYPGNIRKHQEREEELKGRLK